MDLTPKVESSVTLSPEDLKELIAANLKDARFEVERVEFVTEGEYDSVKPIAVKAILKLK